MLDCDRNTGEFRSYREGSLLLKTSNQGDVTIKWNKILSITSDKTFEIELVDGTRASSSTSTEKWSIATGSPGSGPR